MKPNLTSTLRARSESVERKVQRQQMDQAFKRIEELEREKEAVFAIKRTPQFFSIRPKKHTKETQSVAVSVWSDWHVEETVERSQVNDMNEYNPEIAKRRALQCAENTLRLLDIYKNHSTIETLIIGLLGDFISNTIHDELAESNAMMPGKATWFAQSLIKSGIDYILEHSDVNLLLVCHSGNHGRMTKKVHVSTEAGNSLEWYMYRNLAELYQGNPRVKFLIAEGMQSYVEALGTTIRFLHGHSIRFAGGVGGIHIPIRKAISQWDKVKRADITVMGHFHQATWGGYYIVNGSLIGYNAFGQFIKADYEPPRQMFFLIHEGRGITGTNYVWLD